MLPATETFDGFVENLFDLDNRVKFVLDFNRQLESLTIRAGRWRALLALEMHEQGRSFSQIGKAYGVSRARALQLTRDGTYWKAHEAQEAATSSVV